jgi:hypothetical protein
VDTLPVLELMDLQHEIGGLFRIFLVDFLVRIHDGLRLLPETLPLAVNILDRYCSKRQVPRHHYRLAGCVSLLIAAKFCENPTDVPSVEALSHICCFDYGVRLFPQMERYILEALSWSVHHPTVYAFIQTGAAKAERDELRGVQEHDKVVATARLKYAAVKHMAEYLSDILLYRRVFSAQTPSELARFLFAVSLTILRHSEAYLDDITVLRFLGQIGRPSTTLRAKYSQPCLSRVSQILAGFGLDK